MGSNASLIGAAAVNSNSFYRSVEHNKDCSQIVWINKLLCNTLIS